MRPNFSCPNCDKAADKTDIKKTFLLFPRLKCKGCNKETTFPAPTGARIIHWALASIFLGIFILGLMSGTVMIPGVIFIAGFWGILADMGLRKTHYYRMEAKKLRDTAQGTNKEAT